MSEQPKPYIPATLAQELGITVLSEDVLRIVAAINRAYSVGIRDGAYFEREECAALAASTYYGNVGELNHEIAGAIRARMETAQ